MIIGILIVISAACILFFYSYKIEPNWIKINQYQIYIPDLRKNLTVAQLADLHLHQISSREIKVKELLEKQIQPDILAFTGDTFDPFGEKYKTHLAPRMPLLIDYIISLPGVLYRTLFLSHYAINA